MQWTYESAFSANPIEIHPSPHHNSAVDLLYFRSRMAGRMAPALLTDWFFLVWSGHYSLLRLSVIYSLCVQAACCDCTVSTLFYDPLLDKSSQVGFFHFMTFWFSCCWTVLELASELLDWLGVFPLNPIVHKSCNIECSGNKLSRAVANMIVS